MNFATPLIVSALWMFIFRKLPTWHWFQRFISQFPPMLKYQWDVWVDCTFCGGFWIALLLRLLAGINFITFPPEIFAMADWFLDALTVGLVALLVIRILDALKAISGGH